MMKKPWLPMTLKRAKRSRGKGLSALIVTVVVAVLTAVGLSFFFSTSDEAPVIKIEQPPEAVVEIQPYYINDHSAREQLARFIHSGLRAEAYLAAIDERGTWSGIRLGPFATVEEATEAAQKLADDEVILPSFEIKTVEEAEAFKIRAAGHSGGMVELSALIEDADILRHLSQPRQKNIYALSRTAWMLVDNGSSTCWNRIYLGPFDSPEEAAASMEQLKDWELAESFKIRYLQNSLPEPAS